MSRRTDQNCGRFYAVLGVDPTFCAGAQRWQTTETGLPGRRCDAWVTVAVAEGDVRNSECVALWIVRKSVRFYAEMFASYKQINHLALILELARSLRMQAQATTVAVYARETNHAWHPGA